MNWPFFSPRKKKKPRAAFTDVSQWIESFGNGDDSALEQLFTRSWDPHHGATATVYQLAQAAWAKRVTVLMERVQRDFQFARSEQGLVLALGSLRASMPPLLLFATWDAFSGEPRKIFAKNLEQTLQKFLVDLDLYLQRQPSSSQALLAEAKNLLTALPQLVESATESSQAIYANTPAVSNIPNKRTLIIPE